MSEARGTAGGSNGHGNTSLSEGERPGSPAPSCVSLKSDHSKGQIITFREGDICADFRMSDDRRSDSPAPSCVSMNSDHSKGQIITFREGDQPDPSPTQEERPDSPTASCFSVKSDHSKGQIITFSEGDTHPDLCVQQSEEMTDPPHCTRSQSDQRSLSTIFKELEVKAIHFITNELKRLKNLLSYDYPESPEEDEKNQKDARDGALNIAVHILRNMSQEILAEQLQQYVQLPRCQQQLRSRLKKKFQTVCEGVPKQGNPAFLDKIYTELYITEGGTGEVNAEHEVMQIERHITKWETPIKCTEIFKPSPGQDKHIRTVLTKGVAGIGKTVSVQKFIMDWADGKANEKIQLIFPLPFRELNLIKDKTYTFEDIIHHFFSETKGVNFSNYNNYSIAFIFDGLDESRLSLDFQHNESICSVTEHATVDVLLTNLIKGNLLPSALVWITSRPAAANQIPPECVDQVTEVRGFNDPQKEEYFRKRITEEELASRIITHLKSSRSLYIMCHIPVFCWMAATVLKSILTEADIADIPTSLTQMYTQFLIVQTKHRSQKYGTTDVEALWNLKTILSLGKLAFQQLEKGNLIFYKEDLRECGIDVTDASVYSGLCTQIFREEAGLYQGTVFCFVHLSIQEFLAALYVFLNFGKREGDTPDEHAASQLYGLFRAKRVHDLQKTAVDLALECENGHLDLFLRFLLGLSLESNQKLLQDLLPQTRSSSLSIKDTVKYIKKRIRKVPNPERCLNLFHCLNELNDHSLVEEVQSYMRKGKSRRDLSLSQLSALAFVLMMSDQELDTFNLKDYGVTDSPARSDAGLLRMLPVVKSSRSAQLRYSHLTVKSCAALSSVLSSNASSLRQLDLSENNLGDSGVELLSTGLEHPNCRLETLDLSWCHLTEKSCPALSSALGSRSSSLTELDLSYNPLGDSGVEVLSAALKCPSCKLRELGLKGTNITVKSCSTLSSALSSDSSSLRHLNLSDNKLGDSGAELLSVGLEHPNCRLEKLHLQKCDLSVRSCTSLAAALRSNPSSLRELDLTLNRLQQSGVELLSALQRDPTNRLNNLITQ
ncbi:NACHT, LRR and PYD domains-containing protein 3-like [Sardina pilchardus]|uniref:NACHT, LRR and PYD domains-containing protein 3-like n=1 Tax=Sardina pilchardus TaxID=27697 RepID=UPI002E13EC7D